MEADPDRHWNHHSTGFLTGCAVNLWLGWNVRNYSRLPGNNWPDLPAVLPSVLPVSLAGIVLDDWLRYWWWGEEKPKYKIIESED